MNNPPAFPTTTFAQKTEGGMTLRDYFAAKAMQKVLPDSHVNKPEIDPIFFKSIDDLEFTTRTSNCLKAESIFLIGDLVRRTPYDLMKIPNLGKKSCIEIKENLSMHGLTLGHKISGWRIASYEEIASAAYKVADAMLKAREA